MKTILLIDFSNTLFRITTVPTNQQLTSLSGTKTGGLYGFAWKLANLIEAHKPTYVIVCCDKKPYRRESLYSLYKADRKPLDEEFYSFYKKSSALCKELLSLLNIPLIEMSGYEADDLIAQFCLDYKESCSKIVINSNDTDLYQLLDASNIFLSTSKNDLYGKESFLKDYPETTFPILDYWQRLQVLSGGHNNTFKMAGVALKTAIKILKNNQWEEYYENHKEAFDTSLKINKFPFEPITIGSSLITKPSFYYRKLLTFFASHDIRLTSRMQSAFELLNEGGF